jgi:citronellol/citronellal dehydrogenase
MYSPDLFEDQVALVTGGRSGIGYGIAEMLLQYGAKVFICARKEEPLREAADRLSEFGPCAYLPVDIREPEAVDKLADAIADTYDRLDILVNNAGGQFPALAEHISDNGWRAVINTNLNGTFFVTKTMANRFFIPQKSGSIVNIIVNMWRGMPGMAHTGAARAGVENLTKTLAQEWATYGIRINSVAPGTIISSGLDTYAEPIRELLDQMKETNLMGRHGTIEEVANAVCFLASPLSSYTSGITLMVDGMDHLHSNPMGLIRMFRGE